MRAAAKLDVCAYRGLSVCVLVTTVSPVKRQLYRANFCSCWSSVFGGCFAPLTYCAREGGGQLPPLFFLMATPLILSKSEWRHRHLDVVA